MLSSMRKEHRNMLATTEALKKENKEMNNGNHNALAKLSEAIKQKTDL